LVCSFVVQVTVAELKVTEELETALMTGGVVSPPVTAAVAWFENPLCTPELS